MKKVIKKYENSNVIILDSEDMNIYELHIGDIVDIELCKIGKFKGKKETKK